jgi:hypothetical protein
MNLKEAEKERQRLFGNFDEHMRKRGYKEVDLQGMASGDIEKRLASGFIGLGNGEYRLELRVQRAGGLAHDFALEFASKMGEYANVEVVKETEVTPRIDVKEEPVCKNLTQRPVPISLGLSVSHENGSAGSIGGIVESRKGDAVLSAAHVIALAGRANKNDWIYQPGAPDVDPLTVDERVGKLWGFVLPKGVNCPWAGRSISRFADRKHIEVGMRIGKIGRTTCYTEGTLSALDVRRHSIRTSTHGNLAFGNLVEVTWDSIEEPFTLPGDSGALYFVAESLKAVALHVAAGEHEDGRGVSFGCELLPMLTRLRLSMVGVP